MTAGRAVWGSRPGARGVLALLAVTLATPTAQPIEAQGLPFYTETALTTAFEATGIRVFTRYGSRGNNSVWATPLVVLPFAPHERVNTKVVVPVLSKRGSFPETGRSPYEVTGFGDIAVAAKWTFFIRNRFRGTTRLAVFGGVSLPTGAANNRFADGVPAPGPLQLGAGAGSGNAGLVATVIRGRWGVSADAGYARYRTSDGVRRGGTLRYDIALGLRFPSHVETINTRTWQLYVEWNGTQVARTVSQGGAVQNTGGHVGFLSPGLQWVPLPRLLLEASLQVPVLQSFNGTQPKYGVRPSVGARFLIL